MISSLLTGVPLIDALVILGFVFLLLLFPGIPVWMVLSKLRWRRKDDADFAAHEQRIAAFRKAEAVTGK